MKASLVLLSFVVALATCQPISDEKKNDIAGSVIEELFDDNKSDLKEYIREKVHATLEKKKDENNGLQDYIREKVHAVLEKKQKDEKSDDADQEQKLLANENLEKEDSGLKELQAQVPTLRKIEDALKDVPIDLVKKYVESHQKRPPKGDAEAKKDTVKSPVVETKNIQLPFKDMDSIFKDENSPMAELNDLLEDEPETPSKEESDPKAPKIPETGVSLEQGEEKQDGKLDINDEDFSHALDMLIQKKLEAKFKQRDASQKSSHDSLRDVIQRKVHEALERRLS